MLLRQFTAAALGLCLAAALSCTRTGETGAPPTTTLRISRTTASDLRSAFARLPDVDFEVVAQGGSSITSLQDLLYRKTDVSMPMADVAYLAYAGQLDEMPGRFDQLRGMAVLTLNALHLLAGRNTDVRVLPDLRGLRVSLGPPGSATALIAERLLEAHGMGLKDVRAERLANPEIPRRVIDGQIDAAFVTFIPPNPGVTSMMQAGARLVEIDSPAVEEIRKEYPFLKRTLIARAVYPHQDSPIRTLGVDALLVCHADVDEDVVYRLLEAYFATRPATRPVNLERAPATPIPLHPGAARYYRQRELAR